MLFHFMHQESSIVIQESSRVIKSQNQASKSSVKIKHQNQASKSSVKIKRQNQAPKSSVKIKRQNQASKSSIKIKHPKCCFMAILNKAFCPLTKATPHPIQIQRVTKQAFFERFCFLKLSEPADSKTVPGFENCLRFIRVLRAK